MPTTPARRSETPYRRPKSETRGPVAIDGRGRKKQACSLGERMQMGRDERRQWVTDGASSGKRSLAARSIFTYKEVPARRVYAPEM